MYDPVVGVNIETGKIFARQVIICGYCGEKYSGGRARCPVCRSKKIADTSTKSDENDEN